MTSSLALVAETRDGKENASRLRKAGRIPAILYGRGIESSPLSVSNLEFSRVYRSAGENTLVELSFPEKKPVNVLIHDVALHPVSGAPLHIDFYQVRMDEEIETSIPLVFVGESAAVKAMGGILLKALDEVTVSCLPSKLPHELPVELSALATFDDQIRVSDIALPEGVKLVGEADTVVALVEPPRSDEEMASLDSKVEADVSKVEGVVKETPPAKESPEAGK